MMTRPLSRLLTLFVIGCASNVVAAPFAYITNSGDDTVSVIDTATDHVVATIPVGAPYAVAINGAGDRVYVTGGNGISIIDATRNVVIGTIPVSATTIAVNAAGTRLYAVRSGLNSVDVIDTATSAVTATVPVGELPFAVAVSPDGQRVYVTNTFDSTERRPCDFSDHLFCDISVSVIDAVSNVVVQRYPIGDRLGGIAVSPDGTKIYVGNVYPVHGPLGVVTIVDVTNQRGDQRIPLGVGPGEPFGVALNPQGTRAYVTFLFNDFIAVVDLESSTLLGSVAVGHDTKGVAVTPDGSRAYVVNGASDSVSVIDAMTSTVVDTIPVGHWPVAFGQFIGPDGVTLLPTPTLTPRPTVTPSALPSPCRGDCDGNGVVTVDELVIGVGIALSTQPLDACATLDSDHSMQVTVDELVTAVNNALNECAASR
jgi:YVTN family beta-propeller protein